MTVFITVHTLIANEAHVSFTAGRFVQGSAKTNRRAENLGAMHLSPIDVVATAAVELEPLWNCCLDRARLGWEDSGFCPAVHAFTWTTTAVHTDRTRIRG